MGINSPNCVGTNNNPSLVSDDNINVDTNTVSDMDPNASKISPFIELNLFLGTIITFINSNSESNVNSNNISRVDSSTNPSISLESVKLPYTDLDCYPSQHVDSSCILSVNISVCPIVDPSISPSFVSNLDSRFVHVYYNGLLPSLYSCCLTSNGNDPDHLHWKKISQGFNMIIGYHCLHYLFLSSHHFKLVISLSHLSTSKYLFIMAPSLLISQNLSYVSQILGGIGLFIKSFLQLIDLY